MNTKNTIAFITVCILLICSCEREWDNPNDRKSDSYIYVGTCGVLTDARDGKQYNTVQIGNQCWMKENLAWLPSVNNPEIGSETTPYYYVDGYEGTNVTEAKATFNYQTYGVLYNWPAALDACPQGWSLPSDDEWTALTDYLGGESVAGGKMKEAGILHWFPFNYGATNSSGFTALPGGERCTNGGFGYQSRRGYWWSSPEYSSTDAWYSILDFKHADVYYSNGNKAYGFSVRCVRDN
nr:fibrobacter succinogenes major paralogous domain-containing protein [Bacteroidota bacterium]